MVVKRLVVLLRRTRATSESIICYICEGPGSPMPRSLCGATLVVNVCICAGLFVFAANSTA